MTVDGSLRAGDTEPNRSVLASVRSHWPIVAASVILFAVLAGLFALVKPPTYGAESSMLVSNPQPTSTDSRPAKDEARYVADQVAILKSVPVAQLALQTAAARGARLDMTARELMRATSIKSSIESNYVSVRVGSGDARSAVIAANSIVDGYRELVRLSEKARIAAELRQVGLAIASAGSEKGSEAVVQRLQRQRAELRAEDKAVDDGVSLVSRAETATAEGVPTLSALLLGVMLGGLIGCGLAYGIDARRNPISNRFEPFAVLGARCLAEIPNFARECGPSTLPVHDRPESASAEAFRFLAMAIELPARGRKPEPFSGDRPRAVAFVAGSSGEGTTTTVANVAFAAAAEGRKVLAVDADVANPGLTRLLTAHAGRASASDPTASRPSDLEVPSLVAWGPAKRRQSSVCVHTTSIGGSVSVIGLGPSPVDASVFDREEVRTALDSVASDFDLVVLDVPAILEAAYAGALLRTSSAQAVLVVRHGTSTPRLREVSDRLELLGISLLGYAYNVPPRRSHPTVGAIRSMLSHELGSERDFADERNPVKRASGGEAV